MNCEVERVEDAAPGVQIVVALQNVFACIVQVAVAEQKAEAAELQIVLVILFDGVETKARPTLSYGRYHVLPQ